MMNEYEILRAEFLNEFDAVAQYNNALYTASAAMLAFGIERQSFLLCLLPYFVTIPIHFLREDKFNMMCKIGAYMYVFLEGSDYKWERRKHRLDTSVKARDLEIPELRIHLQYYLSLIISSLLAALILLFGNHSNTFKTAWMIAIVIITFSGLFVIYRSTVNFKKVRASYIKRWMELKSEETSERETSNKA